MDKILKAEHLALDFDSERRITLLNVVKKYFGRGLIEVMAFSFRHGDWPEC